MCEREYEPDSDRILELFFSLLVQVQVTSQVFRQVQVEFQDFIRELQIKKQVLLLQCQFSVEVWHEKATVRHFLYFWSEVNSPQRSSFMCQVESSLKSLFLLLEFNP